MMNPSIKTILTKSSGVFALLPLLFLQACLFGQAPTSTNNPNNSSSDMEDMQQNNTGDMGDMSSDSGKCVASCNTGLADEPLGVCDGTVLFNHTFDECECKFVLNEDGYDCAMDGKTCENGACVMSGCSDVAMCAAPELPPRCEDELVVTPGSTWNDEDCKCEDAPVKEDCAEDGDYCFEGQCVECREDDHCDEGMSCCNGTCIDVMSDENNCGSCGLNCGDVASCSEGLCLCSQKDEPDTAARTISEMGETPYSFPRPVLLPHFAADRLNCTGPMEDPKCTIKPDFPASKEHFVAAYKSAANRITIALLDKWGNVLHRGAYVGDGSKNEGELVGFQIVQLGNIDLTTAPLFLATVWKGKNTGPNPKEHTIRTIEVSLQSNRIVFAPDTKALHKHPGAILEFFFGFVDVGQIWGTRPPTGVKNTTAFTAIFIGEDQGKEFLYLTGSYEPGTGEDLGFGLEEPIELIEGYSKGSLNSRVGLVRHESMNGTTGGVVTFNRPGLGLTYLTSPNATSREAALIFHQFVIFNAGSMTQPSLRAQHYPPILRGKAGIDIGEYLVPKESSGVAAPRAFISQERNGMALQWDITGLWSKPAGGAEPISEFITTRITSDKHLNETTSSGVSFNAGNGLGFDVSSLLDLRAMAMDKFRYWMLWAQSSWKSGALAPMRRLLFRSFEFDEQTGMLQQGESFPLAKGKQFNTSLMMPSSKGAIGVLTHVGPPQNGDVLFLGAVEQGPLCKFPDANSAP